MSSARSEQDLKSLLASLSPNEGRYRRVQPVDPATVPRRPVRAGRKRQGDLEEARREDELAAARAELAARAPRIPRPPPTSKPRRAWSSGETLAVLGLGAVAVGLLAAAMGASRSATPTTSPSARRADSVPPRSQR